MLFDINNKKLAINGGNPVRNKEWLDNFTTSELDKKAMLSAFDSGYLSKFEGSFTPDEPFSFYGGPFVQELESKWASCHEAKHAVSMNSATSAIYAAFGALKIGFGDEVIVPAITMTACAIGLMQYGAIPIFADVEYGTGSICPVSIAKLITPRTKAILVVHLYGYPANMHEINKIAKQHDLKVIEDCAQSHLATINEKPVGTLSDIGIYSLNVNKTIQVGEGGICITNDDELCYRLQLIRNHGEAVVGPAGYQDITNIMGFNYRLTEIPAAIGITQLQQLESLTNLRLKLVQALKEILKKYDFIHIHEPKENEFATYYQFKFLIDQVPATDCQILRKILNAEGCYFFGGYKPLYYQPVYQNKRLYKNGYPWSAVENKDIITNYGRGSCPTAEKLTDITFTNEHIRPPNTEEDIDDLAEIFEKVFGY